MLGPSCVLWQMECLFDKRRIFPITKPKAKQTKEPCPDFLDRKFGRIAAQRESFDWSRRDPPPK